MVIPSVTLRPRASLGRVLDDLGATLLDLVAGDAEAAPEIGGVVIHDPLDAPLLPLGALVLGVGVESTERVADLLGVSIGTVKSTASRAVARLREQPGLGALLATSDSH